MLPLLVCGNANLETVLKLEGDTLPLQGGFFPHALTVNVSGVGANLALTLDALGTPVRLLSLGADDVTGRVVRSALGGVQVRFAASSATPQSLALVRADGSRTFYRDPKDTLDAPSPSTDFVEQSAGCAAVLMSNVAWTRALLPLALEASLPILTDVHDIRDLDNPYDQDYFRAAEVLFLSAEQLEDPEATLHTLLERFSMRLIVAGWGARGALLLERGSALLHQSAFERPVLSTGGAGDALFASFAHFHYSRGHGASTAVRLACAAAALKLGAVGSGEGHPDEATVLLLAQSA